MKRAKNIKFFKCQASANDFILIDKRKYLTGKSKKYLSSFAEKYCLRKKGIGADGLLVIEAAKGADFRMRIFNPDGSEAQMCGNGARCAALWAGLSSRGKSKKEIKFATKAGIIQACPAQWLSRTGGQVSAGIKIKVASPTGFKEDIPFKVFGRPIRVNFINSGVPHAVVFVDGLEDIDVETIGRSLRFDKKFSPQGANVNFVEPQGTDCIKIRTYERGVEAETLACGTGSIASAVIFGLKKYNKYNKKSLPGAVKVKTSGGETLTVSLSAAGRKIKSAWLEGRAFIVYEGSLNPEAGL